MPIPKELKETPKWTLSSDNKIPIHPAALGVLPPAYRLDVPIFDHLKTYSEAVQYREVYTEKTVPTFWVDETTDYVIVDIEPKGALIPNNPYLDYPFLYLERSQNGGYHGILKFKPSEKWSQFNGRQVLKDPEYETEILLNNHFCRFTEFEIPIEDTLLDRRIKINNSPKWQDLLAKKWSELISNTSVVVSNTSNVEMEGSITARPARNPTELRYLNRVFDKYPQQIYEGTDYSYEDNRYLKRILGYLMYLNPEYISGDEDAFRSWLELTKYVAEIGLIARDKHTKTFNSNGQQITYLDYWIYQNANYLKEKAKYNI